MKISVIAPSAIPSNTANSIQVMKVCQAMVKCGYQVCLWVPGEASTSWEILADYYGVSSRFEINWVHTQKIFHRYDLALKATWQARKWNPDILYTWMPQVAVIGITLKIPTVLEVHMLPSGLFGPFLYKGFLCARGKKRLLPITQALYRRLEQSISMQIPSELIRIAPMGYDPEQYDHLPDPITARRQLGLPVNRIIAGYSGHLYPGRGMDILIDLACAYPEVHFIWNGGREEDVREWESTVSRRSLTNITLTGFVHHSKLPLYQIAADVLLMPYERTVGVSGKGNTADVCSPMKMFDYLAAGKAILTSDLPTLHEVLSDQNAMFCPPGESGEWVKAFGRLVHDDNLRKRLSDQARLDSRKYSWVSRVNHTLDNFVEQIR